MSDAQREQLTALLDDIYATWVAGESDMGLCICQFRCCQRLLLLPPPPAAAPVQPMTALQLHRRPAVVCRCGPQPGQDSRGGRGDAQ